MAIYDMLRSIPIDFEPKRKNRFIIQLPTDMGFSEWIVQTSGRPKVTINDVDIPYMNTHRYVAGSVTYETMDITFIDPINASSTNAVNNWVEQHIDPSTGAMGHAANYQKDFNLIMLGPDGTDSETWLIEGAQIASVDYGDLDHGSDDLVNVTITVRYARAILVE